MLGCTRGKDTATVGKGGLYLGGMGLGWVGGRKKAVSRNLWYFAAAAARNFCPIYPCNGAAVSAGCGENFFAADRARVWLSPF